MSAENSEPHRARTRLTRECSPDGHVAPDSVEQRHTHRSDRSRYLPQQPRPGAPRRLVEELLRRDFLSLDMELLLSAIILRHVA